MRTPLAFFLICSAGTSPGVGQEPDQTRSSDPVVQRMWQVGMEDSQLEELAHVLIDRIGPRLPGSPGLEEAQAWLLETFAEWGIEARTEQYGTWRGWTGGILHVDMIQPRVQTLEAELLGWSPGTEGPVEGEVVMPPQDLSANNAREWLGSIRGKFLLTSPPEPSCRAPQELEQYARPETVQRIAEQREATQRSWFRRFEALGGWMRQDSLFDAAGAAGIISSRWSGGWGVQKVFDTRATEAVGIAMSCEDYGLLARLVEGGEPVRLRVEATSRERGSVPQFNVIAELKGTELPDEYVLLGAHLDSWHGGTGATDNGTGTLTMVEAMRILKETYPNPRRTIIAGLWGAEEMGLIGSSSFREDHPEVMEGLQVAFNQDNGTWRFEILEGQGFQGSTHHFPKWMAQVPGWVSDHVELDVPGPQDNRGSDHMSFLCAGAPSFRLQSPYDEYRQYTWHTNLDTFDKIVFDDLKENATLAAMLAYLASEDPVRFDRTQATLPVDPRTGEPRAWPTCRPPRRAYR